MKFSNSFPLNLFLFLLLNSHKPNKLSIKLNSKQTKLNIELNLKFSNIQFDLLSLVLSLHKIKLSIFY